MDKNKNVYLVLTEYQFLQAVNLSTSIYNDSNHINIIYVVRSGKRLMGIDATEQWALGTVQVNILDNEAPKEIFKIILNEQPNHFFIFQGNSALNIFLGDSLSRKGVEISLGPDGYGMYSIYNKKHPILSFIKNTYKGNRYLLQNRLFNGRIYRFDHYKYGNHKFIDNIWVTHPEKYIHQAKNKVNILKLPIFNKTCIDYIKKFFNFNDEFPTDNVIYYFNQPLWTELIERELSFLEGVLKNFPNENIILKLHPLTPPRTKSMYQAIDRLKIIESSVPAEVILLNLKNCIVFTGWSSVLITENTACNYYFNYNIYKNSNVKFLNQSEIILLDHIALIEDPKLMMFPHE